MIAGGPNQERRPTAQQRENAEPSEQLRPIPLAAAAVTLATVLFGAGYLLVSESFGLSSLGDRRTLADLSGTAATAGRSLDGRQIYVANCLACHQANGKGLPGVFPPLAGSEWVQGDERVLANILLHGVSGDIVVGGATYRGAMPSFRQLGDAELAAVATYIRAEWNNKAPALDPERFRRERQGGERHTPFAGGAELQALATRLSPSSSERK